MAVLQNDNTGTPPFQLYGAGTGLLPLQQGEQQLAQGASPQQRPGSAAPRSQRPHSSATELLLSVIHFPS